MQISITNTILISCLSSFLITSSSASLRGEKRHLNSDRAYSVAGSGGGSGRGAKPSSKSSLSMSDIIANIIANTEPFPSDLAEGTEDALFLGWSVSSAGDINGDGVDDVIVGAPQMNNGAAHPQVGAAFVIFGQQGTLPQIDSLADLDGKKGFSLYGEIVEDQVGYAVSPAGDVNGDGIDDIIIGAPGVDGYAVAGSGQAYVIFGSLEQFPPELDLSTLDGTNGFVIQGNALQDYLGSSVAAAGDVNGDGIDDIIVGAPNADNEAMAAAPYGGEAYVVFGSNTGFPSVLFISDLNGSNGFTIEAEDESSVLGRSVAAAGDLNGDGIGDLLVGAIGAANPTTGDRVGALYVIYGSSTFKNANFFVSSLDGVNGYKILGDDLFDEFGYSVAALGDVNGDGVDDFVVGCPSCRPSGPYYSGAGYIFYGRAEQQVPALRFAITADSIVLGENSFDGLGEDVSSAGDVNGDGINDIVIGAGRSIGNKHAVLAIIYGQSSDLQKLIDFSDIADSTIGTTVDVYGDDFQGQNDRVISVSLAGDFNGDGTKDLIVGLPDVDPGTGPQNAEGHVKVLLVNKAQFQ